jgi:hypothetical protein
MRNALANAGKQGRRVVAAFIGTAFAQDDAEAARSQWRQIADQLRPRVKKLAELTDEAESDVLFSSSVRRLGHLRVLGFWKRMPLPRITYLVTRQEPAPAGSAPTDTGTMTHILRQQRRTANRGRAAEKSVISPKDG